MKNTIEHMNKWRIQYRDAFKSAEDFWKYFFIEMEKFGGAEEKFSPESMLDEIVSNLIKNEEKSKAKRAEPKNPFDGLFDEGMFKVQDKPVVKFRC